MNNLGLKSITNSCYLSTTSKDFVFKQNPTIDNYILKTFDEIEINLNELDEEGISDIFKRKIFAFCKKTLSANSIIPSIHYDSYSRIATLYWVSGLFSVTVGINENGPFELIKKDIEKNINIVFTSDIINETREIIKYLTEEADKSNPNWRKIYKEKLALI